MKRRILSIALGITMLVGLLPTTALAAETDEARWTTVVTTEGTPDYEDAGTGTLKEAFAAANDNEDSTTIYVQLNKAVTSSDVSKPFQLKSNKSMVLDLNGNSVTVTCSSSTAYGIYINKDSSLTVKDGAITVEQTGSSNAYGIYADQGILTVENCTIGVESSNRYAYGIYANESITVSGGSICAVCTGSYNAYGVYLYACDMTMRNSPAISGGTADIYLTNLDEKEKIFLTGTLSGEHLPYSVLLHYPDNTFANSVEGCGITADNFSSYFEAADDAEEVVFDNGELKLVNKPYVRFYTGNGTSIDQIYLPYSGGTVTQPAEPAWEGYTFAGWYADDTYTNEFDFNQTITENTKVYAKWTFAATGAEPKDSEPLNGIYGYDLNRLIEETLSKLSIVVTGENGASLSGLYTEDWTVKEGQDLAAVQPGDTITFVGKLTAPTATNYDAFYNNNDRWYGRLPQWADNLAVEADVVLNYYVKADNYTYITNPDRIMAYRTTNNVFDIQGYFGGKWKQTSFSNYGYETYLKVGETTEKITLKEGGHDTSSDLNVAIDFDFLNNGQTLQIKYTVTDKRSEGDPIAFSLGSGTDIQIGADDGAIITELLNNSGTATGFMMKSSEDNDKDSATGEYAQFNFFGKGYVGVTDVSDFWYGAYNSTYVNTGYYWSNKQDEAVFFSNENSLSGTEYGKYLDSAATWHWDDRIEAGETKTYSVLIGIGGAGSENAAQGGGLTEPTGSVTIELSEDLTNSDQLVVKLGENTLIENTDYTVDLTDPDKPVITFTEVAGLNVSSGDLIVTVTFANQGTEDVTITNGIPGTGNVSTEAGAMDGVTAEGLDELAKDEGKDIVLTVKEEEENTEDNAHIAINAEAGEKEVEFLDITLKDKNDGSLITGEISKLLEISIPFDSAGKYDITVYRYHDNEAETMKKDPDSGEEGFVVEEGSITIYAKKFSAYAIGYTLEDTSSSDDPVVDNPSNNSSNRKPKYDVKYEAENTENGSVEVSRSRAAKGKTVTITVLPDEGYQLDELLILDKNGNEVAYKDKGDGKYTFVMPRGEVEIQASFAKIEKEQLILIFTIDEKEYQKNHTELMNDVAPVIKNDRTMLPIRVVAESLGAKVVWSEPNQSVTITMDDKEIVIYVGQPFALVEGNPVELDSPAFIANDRTYLPMRFVAENLGATVTWDGVNQTVTIVG